MINDWEEMRKGAVATQFDVLHSTGMEESRKTEP
jgi:hypothetical protein